MVLSSLTTRHLGDLRSVLPLMTNSDPTALPSSSSSAWGGWRGCSLHRRSSNLSATPAAPIWQAILQLQRAFQRAFFLPLADALTRSVIGRRLNSCCYFHVVADNAPP